MSKWFRFYSDAMRNPKVAKLSDREFRLWVQVLSVASENEGRIPPTEELKHVLNARLDHLLTGLKRLISGGLIDRLEDGYEPHNWKKFQYRSDTSTERVRKHRSERNVSETPPDTETEQRQKIEPIVQQTVAASAAPQGKYDKLLDQLLEANGIAGFRAEKSPGLASLAPILGLLEAGYDLERDILQTIRARRKTDARTWSYFVSAIREAGDTRRGIAAQPKPQEADRWPARVKAFRQDGTWASAWGPKPGEPGCEVPDHLLEADAA